MAVFVLVPVVVQVEVVLRKVLLQTRKMYLILILLPVNTRVKNVSKQKFVKTK